MTDRPAIEPRLRPFASIVPKDSLAGHSLMVIIAIMTYLGALTLGAVDMMRTAADDWQSSMVREATLQLRPLEGRDLAADTRAATEIARRTAGIDSATAYSREETVRLLEPWLGPGLAQSDLPIPRLVVLRLSAGSRPDLKALAKTIAATIPGVTVDDHQQWFERLKTMARTVTFGGALAVGMMILTAALSVVFATRAAMATNRPVVEVLHFVGAKDGFVARQFEWHFLSLGLRGGIAGGAMALATLYALAKLAAYWRATPDGDQLEALFGSFTISWTAYGAIICLVGMMALASALTSRLTVLRTLRRIG